MKKGILSIAIMIIIALMLFGCEENEVATDKPIVAVSIVPEKAFVEAVCGDLVEIIILIPPGNSPANYEPTPKEVENFSKAEIYFAIGVPTEENSIMPMAEEIDEMKIIKLQEEAASVYPDVLLSSGERDPHIWLSPKRAIVMVESIAEEMSEIDPDNQKTYEKNAEEYTEKLRKLDEEINEVLEGVEDRKFIVFHPAFGYLADDYDIEMYALEEDGKEATPKRLAEMIDFAKKENIKVIFYQAEISGKQAEAFAEEIGGETVMLEPLAEDYIDNLMNMVKLIKEVT